jgi:N-acetylmuramoyl-L-alanine amidase
VPSATPKTHRTLAAILAALLLLGAAPAGDEKRISVYSSVASYNLAVLDRAGHEYVALLEVLEPLGRVSAGAEGKHWKLRYNNVDGDFVAGKTRAKIRGRDFDLTAPFITENSRGLVPLNSLSTLLPRFLGNPATLHEAARRLFIGDVATQVTAQLDSTTPSRLVLNFTAPVNPTISTEPGKLRMVFTREPLLPPANPSLVFDSKAIPQATFLESNGTVELTVLSSAPLMASFANSGRTITISAPSANPVTSTSPPQAPTGSSSETPPPSPPPATETPAPSDTPSSPTQPRRILAVIDPAHGGSERGAALSDTLAEKNVTLGFARLLRHELEQEGFSVLMLREGDDTLTLDQRAGTANSAHAAIYIALHADSQGNGARVYTALLPPEGPRKGPFHAWNVAQAPALSVSANLAAAIARELQKREIPIHTGSASLRPLNNLLMPALAVELAPGPKGVSDLPSANYQQKVAAAIADAVASFRDRLGAQP